MRELAERRHALIAEADRQRDLASQAGAGIRAGLGIADRGLVLVYHLKRRPIAVGLVAAALTLLMVKPRQAVRWLGYGMTGYTMLQRARRLVASFSHSDSSRQAPDTLARRDN
jgi:YqjK-like protein